MAVVNKLPITKIIYGGGNFQPTMESHPATPCNAHTFRN